MEMIWCHGAPIRALGWSGDIKIWYTCGCAGVLFNLWGLLDVGPDARTAAPRSAAHKLQRRRRCLACPAQLQRIRSCCEAGVVAHTETVCAIRAHLVAGARFDRVRASGGVPTQQRRCLRW